MLIFVIFEILLVILLTDLTGILWFLCGQLCLPPTRYWWYQPPMKDLAKEHTGFGSSFGEYIPAGTTKIWSEAAARNVWKVPLAIIRPSLQVTSDPFPANICKVLRTSCEDYARLLKQAFGRGWFDAGRETRVPGWISSSYRTIIRLFCDWDVWCM